VQPENRFSSPVQPACILLLLVLEIAAEDYLSSLSHISEKKAGTDPGARVYFKPAQFLLHPTQIDSVQA